MYEPVLKQLQILEWNSLDIIIINVFTLFTQTIDLPPPVGVQLVPAALSFKSEL